MLISSRCRSGPGAALACVIIDRSSAAVTHMSDATSTHVEAGPVVWVRVQAVRFAITEARSRGVGGGGGGSWSGGGSGCGASARFRGGGRRQWGQLYMIEKEEMDNEQ